MYPYGGTAASVTFTGGIVPGTTFVISYPYTPINKDVRGNNHVDTDRMAELQKLIAKSPNRTDLKMELMELQKRFKPKIGKRKKKK